jgi:hypothetical protein
LIIDYIFDWARDIYREAIISQLRSLSASDTPSLANDSDIYSMLDQFNNFLPDADTEDDCNTREYETGAETCTNNFLRLFDSPHGAIRDARHIQSRFMSLYLTEDNISLFFRSMKTPKDAQTAARTIMRYLKDCWRVDREALDSLEAMWTGNDRENENIYSPRKVFLVMVTVSTYLSPSWEQIRELSYIAISASVLEAIVHHAQQPLPTGWDTSQLPYVESEVFVGTFSCYRQMRVQYNLLAAVSRACLSTRLFTKQSNKKKDIETPMMWATSIEERDGGTHYRFDAAFGPDNNGNAREFVLRVYNLHRIGRNEPSSSILRLSSRLDDQSNNEQIENLWPDPDVKELPDDKIVAIISKNPSNISAYPEFCLFVMDDSSIEHIMDSNLDQELVAKPYLRARRQDAKPGWTRGWNDAVLAYQAENGFGKVINLFNHVKDTSNSFGQDDIQHEINQISGRQLKTKNKTSHWIMHAAVPMGLRDVMKFQEHLRSRGRKLTSLTLRGPTVRTPWNSEKHESPSRPQAAPRTPKHSVSNGSSTLEKNDADSFGTMSIQNTSQAISGENTSQQTIGFMSASKGKSRKRFESSPSQSVHSDENFDRIDEPSSSSSSRKRQRTDINHFDRNYLTDDELEKLMADGYFS